MSRSVTVAVAYIMSTTNLSWKEALKVVRVGRSIANPNAGFQQQLEDFESSRLQEVRSHTRKSSGCLGDNGDIEYLHYKLTLEKWKHKGYQSGDTIISPFFKFNNK